MTSDDEFFGDKDEFDENESELREENELCCELAVEDAGEGDPGFKAGNAQEGEKKESFVSADHTPTCSFLLSTRVREGLKGNSVEERRVSVWSQ